MSRRKQLNPKALKGSERKMDDSCAETPAKRICKQEDVNDVESLFTVKIEEVDVDELEDHTDNFSTEDLKQEEHQNLIECQLCDDVFDSIAALQTHTISAHVPQQACTIETTAAPSQSLVCQQCDAILPHFAAFAMHMRSHLAQPTHFGCHVCGQEFNSAQDRLHHMVDHFLGHSVTLRCVACPGLSFKGSPQLIEHAMDSHLKISYKCVICGAEFLSQNTFKDHFASHSVQSANFLCKTCDVVFDSLDLLTIHVQLLHENASSAANAPTIDVRTVVLSRLLQSQAAEASSAEATAPDTVRDVRQLTCSVCDVVCAGEDALDTHRLHVHSRVGKSDKCGACQSTINTHSDLLSHSASHSSMSQISCAICRMSVRSEAQLRMHSEFHLLEPMQVTPTNLKAELACPLCNKAYSTVMELETHLIEHEETPCCPHCSTTCTTSTQLMAHVSENHSEERCLYTCAECELSFRFRIHYETHRRTQHQSGSNSPASSPTPSSPPPSVSPQLYQCPKCPKQFHSPHALQGHSHVHSMSPKIHRCPRCGLAFNTMVRLDAHIKRHNNYCNAICQICGEQFSGRDDLQLHMSFHMGSLEHIGAQLRKEADKTTIRT